MKKIILFIFSFFIMINRVDAMVLECPTVASLNEKISCKVKSDKYIGLKANYEISDELKYNSLKLGASWKKYYVSDKGFSVGNIKNSDMLDLTLNFDVTNLAKVNSEYQVKMTNIEATDKNYKYVKLNDLSSKIKIVSNVNTLKKLEVEGENLRPKFDSNVTSYKINTDKDFITISASPTDSESKVTGDVGKKKLYYGTNIFVINVTSVKGEIRKYYIYATRNTKKLDKNSDITLKELSLSCGNIDVDYKIDTVKVKAIPNSNKAIIKIDKPDKLEVGENFITITVTAEDGTVGKYVIVINKGEKLSDDATIKSLNVYGYSLKFKSNIYKYELEIADENKLNIEVELNSNKATYKIIGNKNLKNNSIITIQVKAEDGSIKNYRIKIIKQNENNSSSVLEHTKVLPLVVFVVLVFGIVVIKIVSSKLLKKDK